MPDYGGGHDAVDGAAGGEDGPGRGGNDGAGHVQPAGDRQHARGDWPHARRGQSAPGRAAGEHAVRSGGGVRWSPDFGQVVKLGPPARGTRSEEHTSELQSRQYLVCRLLLEKKKKTKNTHKTVTLY